MYVKNFLEIWYYLRMATVYLPYGYPQLGGAFDSIVYQGTVARKYVLAVDPRTVNQQFERKLLSDVSKMRSSAGKWAKAAWKINFGVKASSVIYQLVKGDVLNLWSDGLAAYDGMSSVERADWDAQAPFQVTYNAPGRVFFALAYVLYGYEDTSLEHNFYMPEPRPGQAVALRSWWLADLETYGWQMIADYGGYIGNRDMRWNYVGAWTNLDGYLGVGSVLKETSTPGDYAELVVKNSTMQFQLIGNTDGANIEVRLDGSQIGFANTNRVSSGEVKWNDVVRIVKPRTYRLIHAGTAGQKFRNDRLFYGMDYYKIDVDRMIGSWASYSSGGPWGSDKWKSTGSGTRAIEFNFVGPWLYGFFDRGAEYGPMRVIVDGVENSILDLGFVDENTIARALFGRFRNTLHHCKIEAVGAAQINFFWFRVLKSKKGLAI